MKNKLTILIAILLVSSLAMAQETIDVIKVHGLVEISEADAIAMTGVKAGEQYTDATLAEVKQRLLSSGKFSSVEVLKRYRSITDFSKVSLVIMVAEKQSFFNQFMYLPVAGFGENGKFVYGGFIGATDLFGLGEHTTMPVIMEGDNINMLGIMTHFDSEGPLFNRITLSAMKSVSENQHFELDDERTFANISLARRVGPLFIKANGGYEEVKFSQLEDEYLTYGLMANIDTRKDVLLPSDALFLGFNWQRYDDRNSDMNYDIYSFDARGFKGLIGRSLIGGQLLYQKSNELLPDYFRPYLGGTSRLRGYDEGSFLGDQFYLATAEIRVPVTSKGSTNLIGFHAFYNVGKIAFHDEDLWDSELKKGAGVGGFWFWNGFGIRLDIASDLDGEYTAHLGSEFTF